ncbi:MAG: hypothetical protein WA825_09000 [Steroidobacteraceae bacterium]
MKTLRTLFISTAFLVLVGCTSAADTDWNRADTTATVASYQDFVKRHPNDPRVTQAQDRIGHLQDGEAWNLAQSTDTAEAFQNYLQQQPTGAHLADARQRESVLERAAEWKVAQADGKAPALNQFLRKFPTGAEADQARAMLAKLDAYRVRLAARKSKNAAERDSAHLQARYGKVLHEVEVVAAKSPRQLSYVESEPMTLADAKADCATLRSEHEHCEVVRR